MDWDRLKKLMNDLGGKIIIVEEGKPQYVLFSLDEFEKMRTSFTASLPQEPSVALAVSDAAGAAIPAKSDLTLPPDAVLQSNGAASSDVAQTKPSHALFDDGEQIEDAGEIEEILRGLYAKESESRDAKLEELPIF